MKRTVTCLPPGPLTEDVIFELIQDAFDEVRYLENLSRNNPDLCREKSVNLKLVRLVKVLIRALKKANNRPEYQQFKLEVLQGRVELLENIARLKDKKFASEFPENPSQLPFRKRNRN
jgi:hypothetical protein